MEIVGLPNADVAFGPDLDKASTQIKGSSWLFRVFIIQSFQDISWKGSYLGCSLLVSKEEQEEKLKWTSRGDLPSRSTPSFLTVFCALETWLSWTTWTGSLALWLLNGAGDERDWKAFCRWEKNEFGVFISLASSLWSHYTLPPKATAVSIQLVTLSGFLVTSLLPCPLRKQVSHSFAVLSAHRSRSCPCLCKVLGTATVKLPSLSMPFVSCGYPPWFL